MSLASGAREKKRVRVRVRVRVFKKEQQATLKCVEMVVGEMIG